MSPESGLNFVTHYTDFNYADGQFNTILYLAAANNCKKTVEYLLNVRNVDPNVKVSEGLTAVHIAARQGFAVVLSQLANVKGIQLSEKDAYGETPLFRAIGNAPTSELNAIVRAILEKDEASVNIPNEDGIYPIDLALMRKNAAVVTTLLQHGSVVSERCYQDAANMMLAKSQPSSLFGGASVFFIGSGDNSAIRDCAKLVIEAYNSRHLTTNLRNSS